MRRKTILALMAIAGIALLACAGTYLSICPAGHFYSQPIIGYHDETDVLSFSGGRVEWVTSHGSTPMGVYSRSGGAWVWSCRGVEWRILPGITRLTCQEIADPTNIFILQRRVFPPRLHDHAG